MRARIRVVRKRMGDLRSLGDKELLARLPMLCANERKATAEVIVYLAEVDRRRLYLEAACSSLYSFCIERLGYSEEAALKRTRVARLVLRLPELLGELTGGAIHLTGLFLLAKHLTEDNVAGLLGEARGKTRREIEQVLARRFPKSDVLPLVVPLGVGGVAAFGMGDGVACLGTGALLGCCRSDDGGTCPGTGGVGARCGTGALVGCRQTGEGATCPGTGAVGAGWGTGEIVGCCRSDDGAACPGTDEMAGWSGSDDGATCPGTGEMVGCSGSGDGAACPGTGAPGGLAAHAGARVEALSGRSYRVEFTAGAELYAKLERAQALLSHAVAPGALAEIFERALDALVEAQTKRRDGAASAKPRKRRSLKVHSRHVPVEVARAIWKRDGERCTFVDAAGRRCGETRFLTLEHRDPFARGGTPSVENLCVLCEPHNQQAARRAFGAEFVWRKQRARASRAR